MLAMFFKLIVAYFFSVWAFCFVWVFIARVTMSNRWYIVFTLQRHTKGTAFDGVFCASPDAALRAAFKRNPETPCYVVQARTMAEAGIAKRLHDETNEVREIFNGLWPLKEFVEFMKAPAYQPQRTK